MKKTDGKKAVRPYFSRFLESQEGLRVKSKLKGGKRPTDPVLDMDQTMKFPSDGDEGEI